MTYKASNMKWFWGSNDVKDAVEVTDDIVTFNEAGQNVIPRFARLTATGRLGFTADAVSLGETQSLSLYSSDNSKKFASIREGLLFVVRTDAVWATAIGAVVAGIQQQSNADGALMLEVSLTLAEPGIAEGALITAAGSTGALGTGEVLVYYDQSDKKLAWKTGGTFTVAANDYALTAVPTKARNE